MLIIRGSWGDRNPKRTRANASMLIILVAGARVVPGGRFFIGTKPFAGEFADTISGGVILT